MPLTTLEMLAQLKPGQKASCIGGKEKVVIKTTDVNGPGTFCWEGSPLDQPFVINEVGLRLKWEIIPEEVDFMTALEAYENGKTINPVNGITDHHNNHALSWKGFSAKDIRGKWIILPDDSPCELDREYQPGDIVELTYAKGKTKTLEKRAPEYDCEGVRAWWLDDGNLVYDSRFRLVKLANPKKVWKLWEILKDGEPGMKFKVVNNGKGWGKASDVPDFAQLVKGRGFEWSLDHKGKHYSGPNVPLCGAAFDTDWELL